MTPMIPTWEQRYMELVGHHEVLVQKMKKGIVDEGEWGRLMADMRAHTLWALANDMERDLRRYKEAHD